MHKHNNGAQIMNSNHTSRGRRTIVAGMMAGLAAALSFTGMAAHAQDAYPSHPIRLIVPYAAGGAVDIVARAVGHKMSESLKQPIIVDNRPGASTNIGLDMAAKAPADGYTLMMGNIGKLELAAHGIALQFASIAFMIPFGLAQVATVRVGLAYGRRDMEGVRKAALAAGFSAVCFTFVGGLIFAVFPRELGALFLDIRQADAQAVLDLAAPLIVIAGVFQLADGVQAVGAGLLRGLKDTRVPMILALIAYWPIGFACAWVFAFPLGFKGEGIWFGFVLGLAAAAFLLCGRFWLLLQRQTKTAR